MKGGDLAAVIVAPVLFLLFLVITLPVIDSNEDGG